MLPTPFNFFYFLIFFYFLFERHLFVAAATNKVICYYESWSEDFKPEDIDITTCTHVNYAFLGLNTDGSLRLDNGDSVLKKVAALKKNNKKLKVLLSVGGWSEGSEIFSRVAQSSTKIAKMVSSSISFLDKYNLDGIDVDWEYPTQRGGKPQDKANFIRMLKALKKDLDRNGYLLTVAVAATPDSEWYNVREISKTVDLINVMAYDFHQASEKKTGHNAPLHKARRENTWEKENANCEVAIKNWIDKGATASKLVLGLAFYGHSFKLTNAGKHAVGDKVDGIGADNGNVPYNKICRLKKGWTNEWDSEQKVPYIYKGVQWISYDNPTSIRLKVQFAKKHKLGGVMIWAVNNDDYEGVCGTTNPLIKEIKNSI